MTSNRTLNRSCIRVQGRSDHITSFATPRTWSNPQDETRRTQRHGQIISLPEFKDMRNRANACLMGQVDLMVKNWSKMERNRGREVFRMVDADSVQVWEAGHYFELVEYAAIWACVDGLENWLRTTSSPARLDRERLVTNSS
jgi:hypothetical protein